MAFKTSPSYLKVAEMVRNHTHLQADEQKSVFFMFKNLNIKLSLWFNPARVCLCVSPAGSEAAEERVAAESDGCLLQGAAGTTGEEGTTFRQTCAHTRLTKAIQALR